MITMTEESLESDLAALIQAIEIERDVLGRAADQLFRMDENFRPYLPAENQHAFDRVFTTALARPSAMKRLDLAAMAETLQRVTRVAAVPAYRERFLNRLHDVALGASTYAAQALAIATPQGNA